MAEDPWDRLDEFRKRFKTKPEFDPELIPTEDILGPRRLDPELGRLKERIDREISPFDIYDRFMPPTKKRAAPFPGQRENIMVSCPTPEHPDEHASTWCTAEGLWYCGGCDAKGDKYTTAALGLGLDVRRDFREVCIRIADAFGLDYRPTVVAPIIYEPTEPTPDAEPEFLDPEPDPKTSMVPLLEWRKIFPPGTFLRNWMEANAMSDSPDEFIIWEGLLAVGLAIGRDCHLRDYPAIFANLYVCHYGPSGMGKSRAMFPLMEVLRLALPYDHTDPLSKGTMMIPLPGSPEALVDSFSAPLHDDPIDLAKITGYGSIRGLLMVDEFASLLARGDRTIGLKGMMTTMYDSAKAAIRSRGHGTSVAEGIFCSVLSSTQPTAIMSILGNVDIMSGFVNRFTFVAARPKKLKAIHSATFNPTKAVDDLIQLRAWASFGREVDFDGDGRAVFEDFFETTLLPLKMMADAPLFARIDLTIKKIILILCANEHTTTATADIVNRAIMFFDYLRYCYETIGGQITTSLDSEIGDWITGSIRKFVSRTGKPPTGRDLGLLKPPRYSMKQIRDAIRTLTELGIVRQVEVKASEKGGRPTIRFMLTELMTDD